MTDLERYQPSEQESPLAIALRAAYVQEMALTRLQQDVEELKSQRAIAAETRDWMTLRAFILRYKVRPMIDMSDQYLALLGQKVASWHNARQLHYRRQQAFHAAHGSVNQYDSENLHAYFTSAGYNLDEDLYQTDRDAGL